jgi:hypothetical protein
MWLGFPAATATCGIYMYVNGVEAARSYADGPGVSLSTSLSLVAGDTVQPYISADATGGRRIQVGTHWCMKLVSL